VNKIGGLLKECDKLTFDSIFSTHKKKKKKKAKKKKV